MSILFNEPQCPFGPKDELLIGLIGKWLGSIGSIISCTQANTIWVNGLPLPNLKPVNPP
jgi:hypothetical protein